MYIKITNLIQPTGIADYKGLELDKIVAGSQIYPTSENTAYFIYDGDSYASNLDIQEIAETEYSAIKQQVISTAPAPIKDRISALEIGMAQILGM